MYKMKRIKHFIKIATILCVFFFLLSCDNALNNSQKSPAMLLVERILGTDETGKAADYLMSDVLEEITEGTETIIFVRADIAVATLEAKLKNPAPLIPGTSYHTSIVVDRYVVTYAAVDPPTSSVPESFEGSLTVRIDIDNNVEVPFVIVRSAAKWQSPLSDLHAGGTLQVVATVTFYGHDGNNYPVEATGHLSIYFTNYMEE
jgi:hypothetical protein